MKKVISLLLAVLMLVSVIPMSASALSYKEVNYFHYVWVGEKGGWEVEGVMNSYKKSMSSGVYKIPDTYNGSPIVGIGEEAFSGISITSLILSNNTQYIKAKAFYRCDYLRYIYMPKTLTSIALNAFNASGLYSVYFQGTKAEWRDLIKDFSSTSVLKNASVFCEYPDYCYHISKTRYEKIEPTCIKTGRESGTVCNDCGDTLSGLNEIPTIPHNPYTVVWEKRPTCTENGYFVRYCNRDENCTYSEYGGDSEPLGHNFARRDPACRRGCGFVCSCRCHKEDFLWKIIQFFYKLFRIKEHCECGYYRTHWEA